jgi:Holliday junction DNA helicase RuvB
MTMHQQAHHHRHHRHHMHGIGYILAGGAVAAANPPAITPMPGSRSMGSLRAEAASMPRSGSVETKPTLKPLSFDERSGNALRPRTFAEFVGQKKLKPLLERLVNVAKATGRPLEHMLLTGSAGTGKTTVAMLLANELNRDCYLLQAPVSEATLLEVSKVCCDGDVVIIDECHLLVQSDRRGVTQAAPPESIYSILEDRRLATPTGVVEMPDITIIGCSTDIGLLPDPLLMRFSLQPTLEPYTVEEMAILANANAEDLHIGMEPEGALVFANASRGTPRIINRYCKNARSLGADGIVVDKAFATEIVTELNSTTLDGLDASMVGMLKFLLRSPREDRQGNMAYQASAGAIATALGFSRDMKRVALFVEPTLIARGFVEVGHGGRALTTAGIARARAL